MSDLIVLFWPIWYFIILLTAFRYARLKPKLSKFIGVSLVFGPIGLLFLSIFIGIYADDPVRFFLHMTYCIMTAIVGVAFIIGASQKQVSSAK
jgi:hypothetical protein